MTWCLLLLALVLAKHPMRWKQLCHLVACPRGHGPSCAGVGRRLGDVRHDEGDACAHVPDELVDARVLEPRQLARTRRQARTVERSERRLIERPEVELRPIPVLCGGPMYNGADMLSSTYGGRGAAGRRRWFPSQRNRNQTGDRKTEMNGMPGARPRRHLPPFLFWR